MLLRERKYGNNLTFKKQNWRLDKSHCLFICICSWLCTLSSENKRRTKHISRTLNPEWHQKVTFQDVHHEEVKYKTLEITVWDYDRFKANDFLGEVVIDLSGRGRIQIAFINIEKCSILSFGLKKKKSGGKLSSICLVGAHQNHVYFEKKFNLSLKNDSLKVVLIHLSGRGRIKIAFNLKNVQSCFKEK